MIEQYIIVLTPILLFICNQTNYGIVILSLAFPFIAYFSRFVTIILMTSTDNNYLIAKTRYIISILTCLYMFKDQEHFVDDMLKNELMVIPLLLVAYNCLIKDHEKYIEVDIIHRYFVIFYLRTYFQTDIEVYIIQMLYYINSFGYQNIYSNLIFSSMFYQFGLIPCILFKIISEI